MFLLCWGLGAEGGSSCISGAPVVWTSHQCIKGRHPSQLAQVQGRRESRGEAEKLSANIKIWHQMLCYALSPLYLGPR